jgi:hypothetical protein
MPVALEDQYDQLRGQFMRCRRGEALWRLAAVVGLNAATMKKFLDGKDVTQESLRKIAAWCQTQEVTDDPTPPC